MKIAQGSLIIAHVRGAPVRIHWTTLLGALMFTRLSLNPGKWAAYFLLVVAHELGHAALVWRSGYQVTAIDVNALGGLCRWQGNPTSKEVAVIAWGGVLAQAAILLAAVMVLVFVGGPLPWFLDGFVDVLIWVNAWMIMINLMPIAPLDGAEAWQLIPILAAERGVAPPWGGSKGRGPERPWSRSAEWLRNLASFRERKAAARKESARKATEKELRDLDQAGEAPPPLPPEIRETLERISAEARRAREGKPPRE